jgi:hypothetical protein
MRCSVCLDEVTALFKPAQSSLYIHDAVAYQTLVPYHMLMTHVSTGPGHPTFTVMMEECPLAGAILEAIDKRAGYAFIYGCKL